MSKLNIDQQTIYRLFTDSKSDFLIPDYQRPYAWEDVECETLWDDLFTFAFPNENSEAFNKDDEYFLGPIVTFKNKNGKLEIIDGQQRLTTLMLLLRAFYDKFLNAKDSKTISTRDSIAKCIWKTDEFGELLTDQLKIDSEVSSDDEKDEFLSILKTGVVEKTYKSRYAKHFRFFQEKIDDFIDKYAMFCAFLPARIMNNCILLPIEAENQDTALRIFSTLNDRGKPLSDSDIFKAQLYKYYSDKNQKDEFIKRWKNLEEICEIVFKSQTGTPMDELFTRYMYYERALQGNQSTTTEALRKFFERESYALLKRDEALNNLESLASFWKKIDAQDDTFSDSILRKLFVLNYAPNGMWAYITSVYYLVNKDQNGYLDNEKFERFLDMLIAFIWAYAFDHPGVNALRTPIYPEMISIVNGNEVNFSRFKFNESILRSTMENYTFGNQRPITKSMLTWWAFNNENQPLFNLDEKLDIEHIYSRKRQEIEQALTSNRVLESLGNKAILEKRINIRAADYRFVDKKKYYKGCVDGKGKTKEKTNNIELINLSEKDDFNEQNIIDRTKDIFDSFIAYLKENNLIQ